MERDHYHQELQTKVIVTTPQQQQQRPQLRRATYVHVSDLITGLFGGSNKTLNQRKLGKEFDRINKKNDITETLNDENNGTDVNKTNNDEQHSNGMVSKEDTAIDRNHYQQPRQSKADYPNRLLFSSSHSSYNMSKGYNVCVLINIKSSIEILINRKRVDKSHLRVGEISVGDETGVILLRIKNEQIDLIEKMISSANSSSSGNDSNNQVAVVLRNCTISFHNDNTTQGMHQKSKQRRRRFMHIEVTKWGKISAYPDGINSTPLPPSSINFKHNYSLIDLNNIDNAYTTNHCSTGLAIVPSQVKTKAKKEDCKEKSTGV